MTMHVFSQRCMSALPHAPMHPTLPLAHPSAHPFLIPIAMLSA